MLNRETEYKIPICKPYFTQDERNVVDKVISSGWISQGIKVSEFEEKFSRYVNSKYSVAVSSGTTALHLAMIVAGISAGDEVICPSLSFIASANAIRFTGANVVFCDTENNTLNIDYKKAESLISSRTKAILIVHQIGLPANIDEFKNLCNKHNLILIEDAACSVGSEYKNSKIGTNSKLVCFSFHPRKVITTGEGGMVTTSDYDLYLKLKALRQHCNNGKEYNEIGYNYRMTDIQAAIGTVQLEKLDFLVNERRKIARKYDAEFCKFPHLRLIKEPENIMWNYQSYCLCINSDSPVKRETILKKLREAGIDSREGISSIHKLNPYREKYGMLKLPITEDYSNNSILLPIYYPMSDSETDYIIEKVLSCISNF